MNNKTISVIGMPMELGQDRRGVNLGPLAIRYALLHEMLTEIGLEVEDLGDISVPPRESCTVGNQKLKYLSNLKESYHVLSEKILKVVQQNHFPLILGGDHSIAIGTISGISQHYNKLGLIWFDAHGDLNTEDTSPSGNIHGMPLAVSFGMGHPDLVNLGKGSKKVDPQHTVIIGARELDPGEKHFIKEIGMKVFTIYDIEKLGMEQVAEQAMEIVTKGTDGVHLSFDLDGMDPAYAPGVGTPVLGGVTYREGHLLLELLCEAGIVTSAEFVEVNPLLDHQNITAELAVSLIASLLGRRTL